MSSSAVDEQALEAFNDLVRRTLPQDLAFSLARNCPRMIDYWAKFAYGTEPRAVLVDSLAVLFPTFTEWILVLVAITTLPSYRLHLIGWRSVAWCFACVVAVLVPWTLVIGLSQAVAVRAAESDLVLAVFVAADICALIVIVIFLRGRTIKPAPGPAPAEQVAVDETTGACDAQVPQEAADLAHQETVLGKATVFDGSQGESGNKRSL